MHPCNVMLKECKSLVNLGGYKSWRNLFWSENSLQLNFPVILMSIKRRLLYSRQTGLFSSQFPFPRHIRFREPFNLYCGEHLYLAMEPNVVFFIRTRPWSMFVGLGQRRSKFGRITYKSEQAKDKIVCWYVHTWDNQMNITKTMTSRKQCPKTTWRRQNLRTIPRDRDILKRIKWSIVYWQSRIFEFM